MILTAFYAHRASDSHIHRLHVSCNRTKSLGRPQYMQKPVSRNKPGQRQSTTSRLSFSYSPCVVSPAGHANRETKGLAEVLEEVHLSLFFLTCLTCF